MQPTRSKFQGDVFVPVTNSSSLRALSLAIAAALGVSACEKAPAPQEPIDAKAAVKVAPGAPGNTPLWAFAGKTGIGTSYEPYVDGAYAGTAQNPVSRVWYSVANGVLTETMYGLIHNAQLRELSFIIKGKDFVDFEAKDANHRQDYLHTDDKGRPESLALQLTSTDKEQKYRIEKKIVTDPHRDSLIMRVTIEALEDGITPFLYADPHIDNGGADDLANLSDKGFVITDKAQDSSALSLEISTDFVRRQVGFEGVSSGVEAIMAGAPLPGYSQTFSDAAAPQVGNVALTGELKTLARGETLTFDMVLGFGQGADAATANARASLTAGFDKLAEDFRGNDSTPGWRQYLASLPALNTMGDATADKGRLLNVSAMVLKAQEDKTHAGALIASLSNPWGDTIPAVTPSTGYKAVWPRDFYQCAMAFLALGDTQTPKVAFEYLKQIQAGPALKGYEGAPGWFLQKTHVDGQIEWVAVQLDQTAMPIMLGWKLWQAGELSDDEARLWYQDMLKSAADFLVSGGDIKLDWNQRTITPPSTQQERWEEQAGFSPSTMAAVITGLQAAAALAEHAGDSEGAQKYLAAATNYSEQLEARTVTNKGLLSDKPYILRISPEGTPDTDAKLADNNGRPGLDQRQILDGGFLELVRYGVRGADNPLILNTLALVDDKTLEDNLRIRYDFTTAQGQAFPGFRRYGNDGYGEDTVTGANYAENGSNSANQRGRVWPFFTGERGHYELAKATLGGKPLSDADKRRLIDTYVAGMESLANGGGMLPEQVWDGVGDDTRFGYRPGDGTNSATPLAWTHAEYVKLVRSVHDAKVWDHYPFATQTEDDAK
ncbi:glycoside hydrolase family 15 protein [Shewanella litorisediminis]|uniref:glycoside hydrolase family 15 protein n=1 Tax=Shewanella litorisediminis TaxID=1173586 RepID=UPI003B82D2E3